MSVLLSVDYVPCEQPCD